MSKFITVTSWEESKELAVVRLSLHIQNCVTLFGYLKLEYESAHEYSVNVFLYIYGMTDAAWHQCGVKDLPF